MVLAKFFRCWGGLGKCDFYCVLFFAYIFCSFHSWCCTKLLEPKNNETMIKTKKENNKSMGFGSKLLALYHPPTYILQEDTPGLLTRYHIAPRLLTLSPHGDPTHPLWQSRVGCCHMLCQYPSPSRPPVTTPSGFVRPAPLAFLVEISSQNRNSLQLNPDLVQDLDPHALQTIIAGEGSTLSILCATVSGIVAITMQLDIITYQLGNICKENQELGSNVHALSSRVANKSATLDDISPLQSALHDLSDHVAAPTLAASSKVPTAPPQLLPAGSHSSHPNYMARLPSLVAQSTPPHWLNLRAPFP